MHSQAAGEVDRFRKGVIDADVMPLFVVELLAHETFGQFALVEHFLDMGRVLILELLVKTLKVLPHVGQDARARRRIGSARLASCRTRAPCPTGRGERPKRQASTATHSISTSKPKS
jgi:hypothetical protein